MKRAEKQKLEDWLDDWSGRSMHSAEKLHLSRVMCSVCDKELTIEENNDCCDLPIKERKCEEHYT
jgi:uncharacterized CHY-type Zn-finger protein